MLASSRYFPLLLLLLCVTAAAVAGSSKTRDQDNAAKASAAEAAEAAKPSLPAVCARPVDQGLTAQPWGDRSLEKSSERTFRRKIATENPGYVSGRDGWKFFTDVQTKDFSQAIGRERLTKTPIKQWAVYFSRMQREAEAKGGKFYVMIAPAKWDVYPEKLPIWAQRLRGTNSLDALMQAYPKLPFIDVRSQLRTSGREQTTYSPLDSHWTGFGGYIAWKAATACLVADGGSTALGVPPIDRVERVADRNEHAADGVRQPLKPQWTVPVYTQPHPETSVTDIRSGDPVTIGEDDAVDTLLLPVETRTRQAQTAQTLLALRDSTGSSLSPLWSNSFARTIQYQHPIGNLSAPIDMERLVGKYRPDITIFTMTERYLDYGPPANSTTP